MRGSGPHLWVLLASSLIAASHAVDVAGININSINYDNFNISNPFNIVNFTSFIPNFNINDYINFINITAWSALLPLTPISFGTILFGTDTGRTFGNCDAMGQNCDWPGYFWLVWKTGIWAWIVAAAVLAFCLLWVLLKCCCCCIICLADCLCSIVCCCFKEGCAPISNAIIWIVRTLVVIIVGVAAAGFAVAIIGWLDLENIAGDIQGNYTQYINSLKTPADFTTATLASANSTLGNAGILTNQSALIAVLSLSQIFSATTAQNGVAANWTTFAVKYLEPSHHAWRILFWVAICVPLGTLVCTLLIGVCLQCNWFLPTLLTLFGLLSCTLLWATIGVTGSGMALMVDVCTQARTVTSNITASYALLNTLQCTQPPPFNEFWPPVSAAKIASAAAIEGACEAVRPDCTVGAMFCPTLPPTTCTTFSQVASLPNNITILRSSTDGGCNNSCTATDCVQQCTAWSLYSASEGLMESVNVASNLDTLLKQILSPITSCQYMASTFIVVLNGQCDLVQSAGVKMIWGMFVLAVASFAGALTTLFLDEFFTGTARTAPGN